MGWDSANLVVSAGSFLFAAGVVMLIVNLAVSLRRGKPAGPNPWDAPTLEWAVPSPPPAYNFAVIPQVASRHPLWEDRLGEPGRSTLDRGLALRQGREALATTPLDARPDLILKMPRDTPLPFLLALCLAAGFTGLVLSLWWAAATAGLGVLACLTAWLWPERDLGQVAEAADV
jgi:cytochrome c oxidase subunit 1/cytochrome c oxidase subunit I+III